MALSLSTSALATPWLDTLEPLTETPREAKTGRAAPAATPAVDPDALRREAEDVLARARAEAAEIAGDALVQAAALREAAWREGTHAGRAAAQEAVGAEMRALWEARGAALRDEVAGVVAQIGTARAQLWQRQEAEMVALCLDIARQVVKTEVTQNPEVVRAVIANALRRITDKDNVRVRVSLADAPSVKEARQDLMETVDGLRHLEIIDDRRVGAGGCVIETNAGTVDARIETQLSEVARALGVSEDE